MSIPNQWTVGTEVAVIYPFYTLGATNVIARFGVDNGIYAWLDGDYIGGAILFMVAATVLFGAARYWRSHGQKKEVADA